MNEYLSQINDNYGIVSDENGEIKVVTKSESNFEFQDVLLKENELEILKQELMDAKEKLNQELIAAKEKLIDNKERTINGELCNLVIIVGLIMLAIAIFPVVSTQLLIYLLTGFYAVFKAITTAICGTRIGRYKENKKLNSSIKSLEEDRLQLIYKLVNLKEKAKYKVESDTKNYCVESSFTKNTSEVLNVDLGKVKVMKLTRKHPKN